MRSREVIEANGIEYRPDTAVPGRLIGYARVSTEDQAPIPNSMNCYRGL